MKSLITFILSVVLALAPAREDAVQMSRGEIYWPLKNLKLLKLSVQTGHKDVISIHIVTMWLIQQLKSTVWRGGCAV